MTTRYYLNSAVITAPGTYRYRLVSQGEARAWDSEGEPPVSTIGYGTTAELLGDILGHEVAVDRTPCTMQPGDEALVLRFRLDFRLPAGWKTGTEGRMEAERLFKEGKFELGILTRTE